MSSVFEEDELVGLHQQHREMKRRRISRGPGAFLETSGPLRVPSSTPPPSSVPEDIRLTRESRENIKRAPNGTRFFCVTSESGETHCMASRNQNLTEDHQKSTIKGEVIEPIRHGAQGRSGHQQVAMKAGMSFDQASARVGYVNGEGYGISIEKHDDCHRSYTYTSAFNCKATPHGGRTMTEEMAEHFHHSIENAFVGCGCPLEEE